MAKKFDKVKQLEKELSEKRQELIAIEKELKLAYIQAFYKKHNLKEGQHFMYKGKECTQIVSCDSYHFSAKYLKKDGTEAMNTVSIFRDDEVTAV